MKLKHLHAVGVLSVLEFVYGHKHAQGIMVDTFRTLYPKWCAAQNTALDVELLAYICSICCAAFVLVF